MGASGTFDGISIYRLDRAGRVYQHEVTDVQLRDPVSAAVWLGGRCVEVRQAQQQQQQGPCLRQLQGKQQQQQWHQQQHGGGGQRWTHAGSPAGWRTRA